ncbi:MAG: polyphenol oxidase family protein [Proteobacteria bacterium]|nr:polyphenol oxidase family protein [Pseudomonadota bacterium]
MSEPLRHRLLAGCGVAHGFGVRGAPVPAEVLCPVQVHGNAVARVGPGFALEPEEADAVVSRASGRAVAVVTADCLPVLACCDDGGAVAAIHAGWRGLGAGVIRSGIAALRAERAGPQCSESACRVVAVVGPHIGLCCYEVDEPVLRSLERRFAGELEGALEPTRPGHARLDLLALARVELARAGLDRDAIGWLPGTCTRCDPDRFHSYRRDGAGAGRLLHHVAARAPHPGAIPEP